MQDVKEKTNFDNFCDEVVGRKYAEEGYIGISNKYRHIGRPDRDDWHIAMAEKMRCAPADYIKRDGTGRLCPQWREHYIRCWTKDTLEVPEGVYKYVKKYQKYE